MKLCASYRMPTHLLNTLDEVRFTETRLSSALDYLKRYPDKRVIVEILSLSQSKISISQWSSLVSENPNLYLDFYDISDLIMMAGSTSHLMYHMGVGTYNMLHFLLQYPVSDVTLMEPLTFDIFNVRKILDEDEERHINLRVNPTHGRPFLFNNIRHIDNGIQHFYILPQHLYLYEGIIDAIDILDDNADREETLLSLYIRRNFDQELKYFVANCESDVPGKLITDEFAEKRMNCRQICMQGQHRQKCHYCKVFEQTCQVLRRERFKDSPSSISSQSES